jgi:hypothetical protein
MNFEEYVALPGEHFTGLKNMVVQLNPPVLSPLRYKWFKDNDRTDTLSLRIGRAAHVATLEPERFALEYEVWRGGKRQGGDWNQFLDSLPPNAAVLSLSEYEKAWRVREAVMSHPAAKAYLRDGQAEQTITWTDADTGLACKARIDYLLPGLVIDLKTAKDISERGFSRAAAQYLYHAQAAHYTTSVKAERMVFICVENQPPFDVAVRELDDDGLWAGECLMKALLLKVKQCQESGEWPGAYPAATPLTMPAWVFPSDGTRELEGYR